MVNRANLVMPLVVEHEPSSRARPRALAPLSRYTAPSAAVGHTLSLRGLQLEVHLGCTQPERARPQRISINATIRFERAPRACASDELSETVCMAVLAEALGDVCRTREFALIE